MNRKIRNLWIKALKGSGEAYYRLGVIFWKGKGVSCDKELSRLCLMKAAELENEKGYLLYHYYFSRGRKVIDDLSYKQIYWEYQKEKNTGKRRRLKQYLRLGTRTQKKRLDKENIFF